MGRIVLLPFINFLETLDRAFHISLISFKIFRALAQRLYGETTVKPDYVVNSIKGTLS